MIPEISLRKIVPPIIDLPSFPWRYEDGGLPRNELECLLAIAIFQWPALVLEIGTFMGQTTLALAECLPDAQIHTVDLPLNQTVAAIAGNDKHLVERRVVGREFMGLPCAARITQHLHNTLTWDFSGIGSPDFCFIDGAHTYEAVLNDTEKCRELGPRMTIVWHDCDSEHPGVMSFLEECCHYGADIRHIAGTRLAYWSDK